MFRWHYMMKKTHAFLTTIKDFLHLYNFVLVNLLRELDPQKLVIWKSFEFLKKIFTLKNWLSFNIQNNKIICSRFSLIFQFFLSYHLFTKINAWNQSYWFAQTKVNDMWVMIYYIMFGWLCKYLLFSINRF